jgi:chromosome segregation ATPase
VNEWVAASHSHALESHLSRSAQLEQIVQNHRTALSTAQTQLTSSGENLQQMERALSERNERIRRLEESLTEVATRYSQTQEQLTVLKQELKTKDDTVCVNTSVLIFCCDQSIIARIHVFDRIRSNR